MRSCHLAVRGTCALCMIFIQLWNSGQLEGVRSGNVPTTEHTIMEYDLRTYWYWYRTHKRIHGTECCVRGSYNGNNLNVSSNCRTFRCENDHVAWRVRKCERFVGKSATTLSYDTVARGEETVIVDVVCGPGTYVGTYVALSTARTYSTLCTVLASKYQAKNTKEYRT